MALKDTLAALGSDNGWFVATHEAAGHRKSPNSHEIIRKPYTKRMEFFRGPESVRVDLTPAGSVERVRTREGFSGTVHNYEWQPGGARQRATIAREALTTGVSSAHVMNYHNG